MKQKMISVVSPCYNEEGNIERLHEKVRAVFSQLPGYAYEHILIDNSSTDHTPEILRKLAAADRNVKVIFNARNFGHIRSPHHAVLQSRGDATILMASDLQDPPELLPEFIRKWEEGYKVVLGVKNKSEESPLMFGIRNLYYNLIGRISEIQLTKNNTGFGLYDRRVVEILRQIDDPYPYFRGLVSDIGFKPVLIFFTQPTRKRGITKNNFYTLYDIAMLGITNHSKIPLRIATLLGFAMSGMSFLMALGYFVAKLIFWEQFTIGTAPILIGLFFFSSIQLFFTGIVGEYIGAIHTQVLKRPLVVEKERLNFETEPVGTPGSVPGSVLG